ncbi:MAG TPA: FHA domain-containing protein [Polyangiaceae bacterium]|nr:FHA domain-containing protein [Polyangiaceae bacterium]
MAQRQASETSDPQGTSDSGLQTRTRPAYALREGLVDYPLNHTPLVVGRGSDADIVLSGPLVSRRHAEFHETEAGVVVIDLGSQNGVLVNDVPIETPTALLIGDRVTIGDNDFVLTELSSARDERTSGLELKSIRESSRVPAGTHASTAEESAIATRRADALHLLSNVADKALALGRGHEAEHVLGTQLVAILSDAVAGRAVAPEVARTAAQYAVKLATATGKASWLDFAFRLYDALSATIPLPIVDEMYTVLRHVRGIDRELLRRYRDFLQARVEELSAPERFVLQRLEGLERLAAWHPAN